MNTPDFLIQNPEGEILLRGHRIDLYHVVCCYKNGYSPEMIACEFPSLPLALIHKVVAFYLENRESVDVYVADVGSQLDELNATLPQVDIHELRNRMELRQRLQAVQAIEAGTES